MGNPAEILQQLYMAGFEFQTFERFPKAIGVIREEFIALLEPTADELRVIGGPGLRMGEVMGVLTTKDGKPVFQAKTEVVDATAQRLTKLKEFRNDLERFLAGKPS